MAEETTAPKTQQDYWEAGYKALNPTITEYMSNKAAYADLYTYVQIFRKAVKLMGGNPTVDAVHNYMLANKQVLKLPKSLQDKRALLTMHGWSYKYTSTAGQMASTGDVRTAYTEYEKKNVTDKKDADKKVKDTNKSIDETKLEIKKNKGKSRRNWWGWAMSHFGRFALIVGMVTVAALVTGGVGIFAGAASFGLGLGTMVGTVTVGSIGVRLLGKAKDKCWTERALAQENIEKGKATLEQLKKDLAKNQEAQGKIDTRLQEDIEANLEELYPEETAEAMASASREAAAESARTVDPVVREGGATRVVPVTESGERVANPATETRTETHPQPVVEDTKKHRTEAMNYIYSGDSRSFEDKEYEACWDVYELIKDVDESTLDTITSDYMIENGLAIENEFDGDVTKYVGAASPIAISKLLYVSSLSDEEIKSHGVKISRKQKQILDKFAYKVRNRLTTDKVSKMKDIAAANRLYTNSGKLSEMQTQDKAQEIASVKDILALEPAELTSVEVSGDDAKMTNQKRILLHVVSNPEILAQLSGPEQDKALKLAYDMYRVRHEKYVPIDKRDDDLQKRFNKYQASNAFTSERDKRVQAVLNIDSKNLTLESANNILEIGNSWYFIKDENVKKQLREKLADAYVYVEYQGNDDAKLNRNIMAAKVNSVDEEELSDEASKTPLVDKVIARKKEVAVKAVKALSGVRFASELNSEENQANADRFYQVLESLDKETISTEAESKDYKEALDAVYPKAIQLLRSLGDSEKDIEKAENIKEKIIILYGVELPYIEAAIKAQEMEEAGIKDADSARAYSVQLAKDQEVLNKDENAVGDPKVCTQVRSLLFAGDLASNPNRTIVMERVEQLLKDKKQVEALSQEDKIILKQFAQKLESEGIKPDSKLSKWSKKQPEFSETEIKNADLENKNNQYNAAVDRRNKINQAVSSTNIDKSKGMGPQQLTVMGSTIPIYSSEANHGYYQYLKTCLDALKQDEIKYNVEARTKILENMKTVMKVMELSGFELGNAKYNALDDKSFKEVNDAISNDRKSILGAELVVALDGKDNTVELRDPSKYKEVKALWDRVQPTLSKEEKAIYAKIDEAIKKAEEKTIKEAEEKARLEKEQAIKEKVDGIKKFDLENAYETIPALSALELKEHYQDCMNALLNDEDLKDNPELLSYLVEIRKVADFADLELGVNVKGNALDSLRDENNSELMDKINESIYQSEMANLASHIKDMEEKGIDDLMKLSEKDRNALIQNLKYAQSKNLDGKLKVSSEIQPMLEKAEVLVSNYEKHLKEERVAAEAERARLEKEEKLNGFRKYLNKESGNIEDISSLAALPIKDNFAECLEALKNDEQLKDNPELLSYLISLRKAADVADSKISLNVKGRAIDELRSGNEEIFNKINQEIYLETMQKVSDMLKTIEGKDLNADQYAQLKELMTYADSKLEAIDKDYDFEIDVEIDKSIERAASLLEVYENKLEEERKRVEAENARLEIERKNAEASAFVEDKNNLFNEYEAFEDCGEKFKKALELYNNCTNEETKNKLLAYMVEYRRQVDIADKSVVTEGLTRSEFIDEIRDENKEIFEEVDARLYEIACKDVQDLLNSVGSRALYEDEYKLLQEKLTYIDEKLAGTGDKYSTPIELAEIYKNAVEKSDDYLKMLETRRAVEQEEKNAKVINDEVKSFLYDSDGNKKTTYSEADLDKIIEYMENHTADISGDLMVELTAIPGLNERIAKKKEPLEAETAEKDENVLNSEQVDAMVGQIDKIVASLENGEIEPDSFAKIYKTLTFLSDEEKLGDVKVSDETKLKINNIKKKFAEYSLAKGYLDKDQAQLFTGEAIEREDEEHETSVTETENPVVETLEEEVHAEITEEETTEESEVHTDTIEEHVDEVAGDDIDIGDMSEVEITEKVKSGEISLDKLMTSFASEHKKFYVDQKGQTGRDNKTKNKLNKIVRALSSAAELGISDIQGSEVSYDMQSGISQEDIDEVAANDQAVFGLMEIMASGKYKDKQLTESQRRKMAQDLSAIVAKKLKGNNVSESSGSSSESGSEKGE